MYLLHLRLTLSRHPLISFDRRFLLFAVNHCSCPNLLSIFDLSQMILKYEYYQRELISYGAKNGAQKFSVWLFIFWQKMPLSLERDLSSINVVYKA